MDAQNPIINIVGDLVELGPLRRDLLPLYQRGINDFANARTVAQMPRPWTDEQEEQWYDGMTKSQRDIAFTIYERATLTPAGSTGLHQIDMRNRTAEFGILIADPRMQGKGLGTETARLMLDYAFTAIGLHSVQLRVIAYNQRGLHAYRHAGFRESGRRRQAHLLNNQWYDIIYMDCLAEEFESPVLAKVFVPDEERTINEE